MSSSVFLSGDERLSDLHDDDAIWVTAFLYPGIGPADSDGCIMQYVIDQIKIGNVVTGGCSISRTESGCISIALPLARVGRYTPGILEHAEVLASWWLRKIHEGTIQLDRKHIFQQYVCIDLKGSK